MKLNDLAPPRELVDGIYLRDVSTAELRAIMPAGKPKDKAAAAAQSEAMQQFLVDNLLDADGEPFADLHEISDLDLIGIGLLESLMDAIKAMYSPKSKAS